MLSILLLGIWDTMFNILFTYRNIGYLGKSTMRIFATLYNLLAFLLQGIGIFGTPYTSLINVNILVLSHIM